MGLTKPTETVISTPSDKTHVPRRLVILLAVAAVGLGAVHAWTVRHTMNPDGVSYLDMGDAYLRGDWGVAVNAYWSPLYAWLLGLALLALKPSPYWEFAVVHFVNFAIYLCAMAAFHFLLRELIRHHRTRTAELGPDRRATLPDWAWWAFGYGLFVWSSLHLIGMKRVNPDLCAAVFLYLAAGLLLRIGRTSGSWGMFVLLGLVLGFGYLTKAAMFPLAFVFLALTYVVAADIRTAAPRLLVALTSFLIVASPFIITLSRAKGRLTFGDSATLNYAWHIDGVKRYVHWQGEHLRGGVPRHPTRKILEQPAIYEFSSPIGGTYPPWYDASYWYEGVTPFLNPAYLARAFVLNAGHCAFKAFVGLTQFGLIAGLLMTWLAGDRRWSCLGFDKVAHASLLIPALAALGMFCLVHVDARYIAAFIVLLWLGMFSGVRVPDSTEAQKVVCCGALAMVVLVWFGTVAETVRMGYGPGGPTSWRDASDHPHWQVADGLARMGIRPGDKVACIGSGFEASYWARLARVNIVAELPPPHPAEFRPAYWSVDYFADPRILAAFSRTDAKAIVAEDVPASLARTGWRRIGRTHHYAYCPAGH